MAEIALVDWYNPISKDIELVTGVLCTCYNCKYDAEIAGGITAARGGIDFTKAEYKRHQDLRRNAYYAWLENKDSNEELKSAHTKETEALEGHGRPSSVPTFFDVKTGGKAYAEDLTNPGAGWSRLWRASIREF
jgi:hypothetical protein